MMDLKKKLQIFRDRFHGRQDVYGRQSSREIVRKDGTRVKPYYPVCNNLYIDVCHIALNDGVPCSDCEHRDWDLVSDSSVHQHIEAQYVHNVYPVLPEGMIRFGAIDFDCKPGKESQGYSFFEVKKFCKILKARGIEYGIARSTNNGYHVYVFFKEPYPAARFRAVISKFFEAAGFDVYVKERAKSAYPEIFPKQDYVSNGFFGNGITPPMIEPLMMKGKKCWVDDNDVMIGSEIEDGEAMIAAQWGYLEKLPWADPTALDKVIEHYALKVEDIAVLKKRVTESVSRQTTGDGTTRPQGYIEKILYGCEAFQKLTARIKNQGHEPSHFEGMALWHLAINTVDGKDWFQRNVTTWGQTQSEVKQLEFSIQHNYRPHSCNWMKEQGICVREGLCAEAAPRTKTSDAPCGALEDLSEQEQKLYNPYRFAFSPGAELLNALIKEVEELIELENVEQKETILQDLAVRIQVLDKRQARSFKEHIDRLQKSLKIAKNRVASIFKAAEKVHYDQQLTILEEDSSVYQVGSNDYRKRFGGGKYGYYQIIKGKESFQEILLCEIDILIQEERYYLDEGDVIRTVYRGKVIGQDSEKNFEIGTDDWASDIKFLEYFTQLMGTSFSPIRKQLENIKQAAIGWSDKKKFTNKLTSVLTQGFYKDQYVMPSVTVDPLGIRPTKVGAIDTSKKDVVMHLDWKILDDNTFLETLHHIKDNFLRAWPEEWTYIGLAHAFRPLIRALMNWTTYPTLFFDGLTGIGKSEAIGALQAFWGDFPKLVNLTVTQKYLEELSYEFKYACLALDDFKNLSPQHKKAVLHQIQYGFDGSSTGKLNRDSSMRKARFNRATTIMSGEGFINHQASVVARTILIEASRFDNEATAHHYAKVLQMRRNYSGITPRFLHWLMGRDRSLLHTEFAAFRVELQSLAKGRQNASRIADNLAGNRLVWTLFTRFMEDFSVILTNEREEMDAKHLAIVQQLFHKMVQRCEEEQESSSFTTILKSLIVSKRIVVEGLHGYSTDDPRAPVVGFIPNPENQRIGYYYPDILMNEVNNTLRQQDVPLQKRTISSQLADLKIIVEADSGRYMKTIRKNGVNIKVWVFDHVALELIVDEEKGAETVSPPKVMPLLRGVQAMRDNYGLY